MFTITEVTAPVPGQRPRSFRSTGVPGVRATGFGTYFAEVRVGGRRRWYSGTFRDIRDADAAARWARAQRDRARNIVVVETLQPIPSRRPPAPIAESPTYTWFGR